MHQVDSTQLFTYTSKWFRKLTISDGCRWIRQFIHEILEKAIWMENLTVTRRQTSEPHLQCTTRQVSFSECYSAIDIVILRTTATRYPHSEQLGSPGPTWQYAKRSGYVGPTVLSGQLNSLRGNVIAPVLETKSFLLLVNRLSWFPADSGRFCFDVVNWLWITENELARHQVLFPQ